jgi:hypothetical protein
MPTATPTAESSTDPYYYYGYDEAASGIVNSIKDLFFVRGGTWTTEEEFGVRLGEDENEDEDEDEVGALKCVALCTQLTAE